MATTSAFLNVRDIDASLRFYKGLGFDVVRTYENEAKKTIGYADLAYDGAELGLGNIQVNDDPEFQQWATTNTGAGLVLYFTVDDVDTVYEKARETGATIEAPIADRPYGRTFLVNDPDGYTLAFIKEA